MSSYHPIKCWQMNHVLSQKVKTKLSNDRKRWQLQMHSPVGDCSTCSEKSTLQWSTTSHLSTWCWLLSATGSKKSTFALFMEKGHFISIHDLGRMILLIILYYNCAFYLHKWTPNVQCLFEPLQKNITGNSGRNQTYEPLITRRCTLSVGLIFNPVTRVWYNKL